MAFKTTYHFEGNSRNKPEQNFSGSTKKLSRDILLQSTHEERRKREEQRLKLLSAEILQTHMKSYIIRKHRKSEERQIFDHLSAEQSSLSVLLPRLLFFYNSKEDSARLVGVSLRLINEQADIFKQMQFEDSSFRWLMKRFLWLCLKNLQETQVNEVFLKNLFLFTNDPSILVYLVKKGYYRYLRLHLENDNSNLNITADLIQRPLQYLSGDNNYNKTILSEFSLHFLKPSLTPKVKNILIPYLRNKCSQQIFSTLIEYLNSNFHFGDGNNMFYCVLTLEPDNFEPNLSSIQVLSKASRNIHKLNTCIVISDDSDDEDTEQITEEQMLLSDYLVIMNAPHRIRKWQHFLEQNMNNEEVLMAFVDWCHNLLLENKDAIRKHLLLYKLGLIGRFLGKLWAHIRNNYAELLQLRRLFQNSWSECHRSVSVFCSMFIFYTETLINEENTNAHETFNDNDLCFMCKSLKTVAKEIIEVAYPMSRTGSMTATPEILQLYKVSLNCLRTLYMLDLREHFCPYGFWSSDKIFIPPDLARCPYLSETGSPSKNLFNDRSSSSEDEHIPPLSTIEQRSLAVLEELPFLIPFNTRFLLLRDLCRNSLGTNAYQRLHNELFNDRVVVIRRTHLYEDAFEKMSREGTFSWKQRTRIQFINSIGLEEIGIDGGGIFKEFINEVLKTAFDPNRGFFLLTADNTLYPNPNVHLIVDNFLEHYYFIGCLIGKAIFENILVELPLAEFFLAKLLVDRAGAHYLKSLDPVLYKNLLYLRDFSGDISDLGLDFTIVNNDLGETRVVELKPNGRNIQVTNENRLEYIQRLADLKLNAQLKKQCAAFRFGLFSVVPNRWLKFFDHEELQIIIGGNNQEIDVEDLKAHTVYGGDFNEEHPTITMFWNVLRSFTDFQKKQLLKFVTSCSRPPLLGFRELNPQFGIRSSGNESRMPSASTCLNLLKLPIMNDEESLRSKLLEAIEQQAGFELS